jgi:hypothetical protein
VLYDLEIVEYNPATRKGEETPFLPLSFGLAWVSDLISKASNSSKPIIAVAQLISGSLFFFLKMS